MSNIYGENIFLNEGLFNRNKKDNKQEEQKINYIERTENFLKSPKTIPYEPKSGDHQGSLYGIIFGLLVTKYNYNDSKFLSLVKNNIDNFTRKDAVEHIGWYEYDPYRLVDFQNEEIVRLFNTPKCIYLIADGADETIWYCKEKNKLFRTDYKRLYTDFSLNDYKEWPNEVINNDK